MTSPRDLLLRTLRYAGCYAVARALTANGLRILCYHGFSLGDEHRFRPKLFMQPEIVEARLRRVRAQGYAVLPLDEAVRNLASGRTNKKQVVITIDDGFFDTHVAGAPLFEALRMPVTLYVTTYYVKHQNPIFGLCVQYMVWRTRAGRINAGSLLPGVEPDAWLTLGTAEADAAISRLIAHGQERCEEHQRVALCAALGEQLDVDYEALVRDRRLTLLSVDELRDLAARGVDIQLHTHRHRLPLEQAAATRELDENRNVLGACSRAELAHFCLPERAVVTRPLAGIGIRRSA